MWRYVDRRQFSPGQSDDDQNIKQLKAEGRNHEQVHGRDVWRMVAQKGSPALTGWLTSCGHVFGNGRLRHRKAELEQLTMNTRRTPKQVLNAHPPDQHTQICSAEVKRFCCQIKRTKFSVHTGGRLRASL